MGALYGFIGPNGAGKTTTLRMIMSILFPDRGELSVLGRPAAIEAKDRIGYLPEERGVYRKMKVGRVPHLHGAAERRARFLAARAAAWLERLNLGGVQDKKCEELSKGMLQKVQLIAAVLHEPDLLILDEPFSGLDPVNMRLLRDLILAEHRQGSDDHLFDARDGAGRGDLRSHRDAAQGTESARRRSRRRFDGGTIRGRLSSSRSSVERMPARSPGIDGVANVARDGGMLSPRSARRRRSGARDARGGGRRAACTPRSASAVARGHLHRARDMRKILLVAKRDFLATVSTKGFIIAIMVPPSDLWGDHPGVPADDEQSRARRHRQGRGDRSDRAGGAGHPPLSRSAGDGRSAAMRRSIGRSNRVRWPAHRQAPAARRRSAPSWVSCRISRSLNRPCPRSHEQKERLTPDAADRQLAVLVVHPNAVVPNDEGVFGAYDLFVRRNLDNRIQNEIRNAAAEAIVDARVRAAGLDRQRIDALTKVARPPSVTVTATENPRREPISPACCRWDSPSC